MFAYCNNNPINYSDTYGLWPVFFSEIEKVDFGENSKGSGDSSSGHPKDSPPDHPDYKPPKKGPRKGRNPNGNGSGWVDDSGNVWVWDNNMHGGPGWIIQEPGGGHSHAYPGGGRRLHCEACLDYDYIEIFPSNQIGAQSYATTSATVAGGCGFFMIMMVVAFNQFWQSMRGSV